MAEGYITNFEENRNSITFSRVVSGMILSRVNATTRQVIITVPFGYNSASATLLESTIQIRDFGELAVTTVNVSNTSALLDGIFLTVVFSVSGIDSWNDAVLARASLQITLSK